MNSGGKLFSSISSSIEKIKSNKKLQFLLIAIIFVAILFLVFFSFNEKEIEKTAVDPIESYVCNLEDKLSNCLSNVAGVGKVKVVITVESGMETVLAMEKITKETSSGLVVEETPVIINGKTVVVKELYPKIEGVLIVAEGASNISVLSRIQQAVISLFDINLDQIEILSMK